MREIVLENPGKFTVRESQQPSATTDHAVVRVHRVGICGTDLHAFQGKQPFFTYPRVLGHELGVEVVEAPKGAHISPGDLCAVEPYVNCGECYSCRANRPNCCERLQVLGVHTDGGMRGFLSLPARLLHKSSKLNVDQLALVETLGIGAHAVTRSGIQKGQRALIIGAGPIGLAVFQFVQAQGATAMIRERSELRRRFAEKLGAETQAESDGELFEVVFDATGNVASMEASFESVNFACKLVFVGLVTGRISFDDPFFHRREMTLIASRNSCHDFPRIIQMIEDGTIDTSPWITDRLPLSEVPSQFESLYSRPNLLKCIIEVDAS
jgi:2-desacetyl-2-hydroxyethyl bacteriochlorophyllide A dehydrogenase